MRDFGITYAYAYRTRDGRDFGSFVLSAADCS
jgi:hypothetical protein